jgi:hypothetical protein
MCRRIDEFHALEEFHPPTRIIVFLQNFIVTSFGATPPQ